MTTLELATEGRSVVMVGSASDAPRAGLGAMLNTTAGRRRSARRRMRGQASVLQEFEDRTHGKSGEEAHGAGEQDRTEQQQAERGRIHGQSAAGGRAAPLGGEPSRREQSQRGESVATREHRDDGGGVVEDVVCIEPTQRKAVVRHAGCVREQDLRETPRPGIDTDSGATSVREDGDGSQHERTVTRKTAYSSQLIALAGSSPELRRGRGPPLQAIKRQIELQHGHARLAEEPELWLHHVL